MLALVDAPELFDRDGLYGDASGDYPDNALALRGLQPRRARVRARDEAAARRSSMRTTGRPASCPCIRRWASRRTRSSAACRLSSRSTTWRSRGCSRPSTVESIGLGWDVLDVQAMEYWGQISYLKGGINFSEQITTVSPTYANEITTPELGFGFDGILRRRAADLVGILNGIDTERWNPAADEFVPASFTRGRPRAASGAKRALLEAVGHRPDDAGARPGR